MKSLPYYFNYFRAHCLNSESAALKIGNYPLAKNIIQAKMNKTLEKQISLLIKLREFNAKRAELPSENIFMRLLRNTYVNWQTNRIMSLNNQQLKYHSLMQSTMQSYDAKLRQRNTLGLSSQPMRNLSREFVRKSALERVTSDNLKRAESLLNSSFQSVNTSYMEPMRLIYVSNDLANTRHDLIEARWLAKDALHKLSAKLENISSLDVDRANDYVKKSNAIIEQVDILLQQNTRNLYRTLIESGSVPIPSDSRNRSKDEHLAMLNGLRMALQNMHRYYDGNDIAPLDIPLRAPRVAFAFVEDMLENVSLLQNICANDNFDYSALSGNETQDVSVLLSLIQERINAINFVFTMRSIS